MILLAEKENKENYTMSSIDKNIAYLSSMRGFKGFFFPFKGKFNILNLLKQPSSFSLKKAKIAAG